MRPETIFYFTLRSSSESPLEACDIILEEVSALLQQEEENTNASPTIQQQAEEQDDGTAVVDPSSIRVS
ncbi:Uncharacterized protein FKW44_024264 [Caligus rogercresseyi]|uniref:Uncharacterized protein n=1 Tax=Caligus rogercresseyi TaxID=217165 RepID=A0A7T8GMJ2_CALRO|nr:Uncharacterized protein FKW44_024264 [Caligus rogercresseyi]